MKVKPENMSSYRIHSLIIPESSKSDVRSPRVARTAVMAPMNAQPKNGVSVLEYFVLKNLGRRPSFDSR